MGRDKALLQLGGRTLVEIALAKLREVCAEVFILSSRPELAAYAPLVADVHPGCGPLGGMEAALLASQTVWSLFLAVDMPFVPAAFLDEWVRRILLLEHGRVALFTVDGIPQPTMCMVHHEVAPFVQAAVQSGRHRVLTVLQEAAGWLAERSETPLAEVLLERAIPGQGYFVNLNTPEEFSNAERNAGQLGT